MTHRVPGAHGGPRPLLAAGTLLLGLLIGASSGLAVGRLTSHGEPSPVTSTAPPGFAHTPDGAAQAAGKYLAMLGGRLALDPAAARSALDYVADPSTRTQLEAGLAVSLRVDESLWGIQSASAQGRQVLVTQTPIAYRVTSYTGDAANVAIWLVVNVGVENQQRLAAFFANGGATVTWLDGNWRLHEIANGTPAGDVVPACLQTPTQTGGVPTPLDGYTPYGS